MRSKFFRIAAGVLALLFLVAVLFTDLGNGPIPDVALFAFIGCVFGLYAVVGEEAANRWIGGKSVEIRHPDDTDRL